MKTVNAAAQAIIATGQFCLAQLYTFTLSDGNVIRITGADIPITLGGVTWGLGPLVSRGSIRQTRGLEVDTLDVSLTQSSGSFVADLVAAEAARLGKLDFAAVLVEEAILADWTQAPADKVWKFSGKVWNVEPDGFQVRLTVKSWLAELEAPLPRNLHQVQCLNRWGDTGCGINRASYQSSRTVTAVSADGLTLTVGTVSGRPADWFRLGRATATSSAANAGEVRTIRGGDNAAGTITLQRAFPRPIAVGDVLTLLPGCDRTRDGGCVRFANTARFRATRFIPQPATLLGA